MNDYRKDLGDLFGDTVAVYTDLKDMKEKIDYFIKNENERKEMSQKARDVVIGKHLWKHRAETLIDFIKGASC